MRATHLFHAFLTLTIVFATTTKSFAQTYGNYENDLTVRVAIALGRSAEIIPEADMAEVIHTLEAENKMPPRYQPIFKRLLAAAQYILEIKTAKHYFSVGYEFESAHATKTSLDDFRKGATAILENVQQTFGATKKPKFSTVVLNGMDETLKAKMPDENDGSWTVVQEWVRDGERTAVSAGWETVTPPIFNRDHLRNLGAFALRLGANPFGREAEFTGAHQTFGVVPLNEKATDLTVGLTATNFMLLQQQYMPAIFDLLKVQRYGGYRNFFIRPIIFDHGDFLKAVSATPANKLTIQYLDRLMNVGYGELEFYHHVIHTDAYSDKEKADMLSWPKAKKLKYPKIWKYRDLRVKFNAENPALTLVETRVGDYRSGAPEDVLNITYFYEKLLAQAYQMAQDGKVFKIQFPARRENETDDAYWTRLKQNPACNEEALFRTLDINPNIASMMKGADFKTARPKFSAQDKETLGFEMELMSENIVKLIIPTDPKMRAKWRSMNKAKRLTYLQDHLEFEFGNYSKENFRLLVAEFQADNFTYPFLDPDLYLEESGNLEIKSHGRNLTSLDELEAQMKLVEAQLKGDYFGMHVHDFIPDEKLAALRNEPGKAEEFVSYLERLSMYMQLQDYKDVDRSEPTDQVDSWSLDRPSAKDLQQILKYLKGKGPLDNQSQKSHNIGIRVVNGGLDIEFRALGDDISYAMKLVTMLRQSLETLEFGTPAQFGKDRPLFQEPRDMTARDQEEMKLANALTRKYNLTPRQMEIARKLQFEIYKPSMPDYMDFFDGTEHNTQDTSKPEHLDPAQTRTNFESNVAIPIMNFSEQSYFKVTSKQQLAIAQARNKFLATVYKLVLKIEQDPQAKFILKNADFLYLADYMERSTHPDYKKGPSVRKADAKAQRKYLEKTVFALRRAVYDFIDESKIDRAVWSSIEPTSKGMSVEAREALRPMWDNAEPHDITKNFADARARAAVKAARSSSRKSTGSASSAHRKSVCDDIYAL